MLHDTVNILVMSRDLERDQPKLEIATPTVFPGAGHLRLFPADDLCIKLEMVNFELKTRDMIYNAYQIAFRKKISRIIVHIEKKLMLAQQ